VVAVVVVALLTTPVVATAGVGPSQYAERAAAHGITRSKQREHWVGSWTASPTDSLMPKDAANMAVPSSLQDQTLRMIITPHLGGRVVRVHLSNRFGMLALHVDRVTVGRFHQRRRVVTGIRPVRFAGRRSVTVPVGEDVVSDATGFSFRTFQPVAVSIYVATYDGSPTKHWNANATSYYSSQSTGDLAGARSGRGFTNRTEAWLLVDGLDVRAARREAAIVAFGDSITDGFSAENRFSQPVNPAIADKNGRYPDDLQRRLDAAHIPLSVVNAGIGSNRLVTDGEPLMMGLSGVQRFREDALDVAGVKGVLLQEGINDFGLPPQTTTPDQLIAGYKKVIAMAHKAGVKIWLGTLLPASNAFFDGTDTAPNSERYREQTNHWIRTQHLADGVVDFDARLRDPRDHEVLNPAYSGPDHLHPNLKGYRVMARVISLAMLKTALSDKS